MFKKYLLVLISLILILTGCSNKIEPELKDPEVVVDPTTAEDDCEHSNKGCDIGSSEAVLVNPAKNFKEHYESVNGLTNANGKVHRTVNISEDNGFIEISAEELMEKLDDNEEFILFTSSVLCPWCRSIIETADKVVNELNIPVVYVLECWDSDGSEIFRNKIALNDSDEVEISIPSHPAYDRLLEMDKNNLFTEVVLKNKDESEHPTGLKRIYLPTFIYIANGEIVAIETGTADTMEDPREELTEEMIDDIHTKLTNFFSLFPKD